MAEVAKYGVESLAHNRKNVKAAVAINEGLLIGLNSDGEAILANASTGVKAVGICYNGSSSKWGTAIEFSKTSTLRVGDNLDIVKFGLLDVTEGTFTNSQIGSPVYLGENGLYTLTQNTTIGQLDQKVGFVWSRSSVMIDLTNDVAGTTVTPSNFDVVEVSADGAIATSGVALVTTGGTALNATLGAPTAGTQVRIKVVTDGGGNLIVTTGAGITFDGTNNTATFTDVLDELVLGYKSATEWIIVENVGSVALSLV